jgi:hypothetical protein
VPHTATAPFAHPGTIAWRLAAAGSAPAGSASGPGKTARRRGSSWLPASWPSARHPRQGHGRLTARLCRDRASYAADFAAGWITDGAGFNFRLGLRQPLPGVHVTIRVGDGDGHVGELP